MFKVGDRVKCINPDRTGRFGLTGTVTETDSPCTCVRVLYSSDNHVWHNGNDFILADSVLGNCNKFADSVA